MNAKQENKVSMYSAVDAVLSENQNVWQTLPAFAAAVTGFRNGVANIQTLAQARNSSTKGVTADKQSKRETMEAAALEVAGAVAAFASDTGNRELQAKADFSDSDLRRARDTEITTICQGIHDEANAVVANLADYGVVAQTLTDLQAKINAYNSSVGKPASAKSNVQAAGASLDSAIADVDKVLDEKLDKLATKFRTSQRGFFDAYSAARSIVDNPGGRKAKPDGNGNGGTPPNN
jgi:hypothetical protein